MESFPPFHLKVSVPGAGLPQNQESGRALAGLNHPRLSLPNPGNLAPEKRLPADAAFMIRSCGEADTQGIFKSQRGRRE